MTNSLDNDDKYAEFYYDVLAQLHDKYKIKRKTLSPELKEHINETINIMFTQRRCVDDTCLEINSQFKNMALNSALEKESTIEY